jgi:ethanolamine utilization protein EutQ (cupin superfamily)
MSFKTNLTWQWLTFNIIGELHIVDEKGNSAKLQPGDTFFIHRGSTITFSTPRYAVAFKSAARHRDWAITPSLL